MSVSLRWRSALVLVLTALSASACVARRTGPDPVPAGEWCDAFGDTMCNWVFDNCTQGAAFPPAADCGQRYAVPCLNGRPRGRSTGRSYDELNRCVDYLTELNCQQLGLIHVDPMHFYRVDMSGLPPELYQHCSLDR